MERPPRYVVEYTDPEDWQRELARVGGVPDAAHPAGYRAQYIVSEINRARRLRDAIDRKYQRAGALIRERVGLRQEEDVTWDGWHWAWDDEIVIED